MKKQIDLLIFTTLIVFSCCACGQGSMPQAEMTSLPEVSLQLEGTELQPAGQDNCIF